MGFCWSFLFFILYISFYPIISSANNENSKLIQETCKNTKYCDLCISLLESDSSGPKSDTRELALIVIRYGIANARDTNSYLSKQIQSVANDTVMKTAMRECADKYASANYALQNSVEVLIVNMYDYAYLHVMAAGDYPNGCRNAFNRWPGMGYPSELALREDGLKRICDVVLGIIDSLDW